MGKTTLAALLAQGFSERGYQVFAIDADPDANLASMLGAPDPDEIRPIADMKELIKERVGATSGDIGSYFTINPRVDDIPDQYGIRLGNIRLLVMGQIPRARGGCACPENILVRELVSHVLTQKEEVVILDMEAGIEHLGRGTAEGVNVMLIVVEPFRQSIETAKRIQRLASDLDHNIVEKALPDLHIVTGWPFDAELRDLSLEGGAIRLTPKLHQPVAEIMQWLVREYDLSNAQEKQDLNNL